MPDATITPEQDLPAAGGPAGCPEPPPFAADVASLFPLPLTTFERYMLADDRRAYPMTFVVQMKLVGTIDHDAFVAALLEAVSRHPLLAAVVRRRSRGGPAWVLAGSPRPVVRWGTLGDPIGRPLGSWIDLESEPGLRVWVHEGRDADRETVELTYEFHHACCDGSGSLRFIGDVLAAYGMRTAAPGLRPILRRCAADHLPSRGRVAARPLSARRRTAGVLTSLRESLLWLIRRPVSLRGGRRRRGTERRDAPAEPFFASARWHTFDQVDARRIRRAAMLQGVTMNDMLVRGMFQTLRTWSDLATRQCVRIVMPVSTTMECKGHRTAANGVSYSFVTRRGDACADPQALLLGLVRENDGPTRRRRARAFLRILDLCGRVPGLLARFTAADRCLATAVFSNLGEIVRHFGADFPLDGGRVVAGSLVLDEILGFPPIRPHTRAAFMVGRYAGRCRICVRCDPAWFAGEDVGRLLAAYVERLRSDAETG